MSSNIPLKLKKVINLAESGVREVKKRGFIPLFPGFLRAYDDQREREEALQDGLKLLEKCEAYFEVKTSFKSEGMLHEQMRAKQLGLNILN